MNEPVGGGVEDKPDSGRRRVRLVLLVAVVVLAVAVGGTWLVNRFGPDQSSSVGDCVQLDGTYEAVEVRAADCGASDQTTWLIAKEVDTSAECPSDNYVAVHTDQLGMEMETICLIPTLVVGTCYREVDDVDALEVAPCPEADFRVDSVHDAEDPTLCSDNGVPYTFPEPARTYCLVDPEP